jgi:hypothetical protein
MCWWWFFTFIHNCVWIFWFNAINVKNPQKSQNEFQWTTKHGFWQDYFLYMWPTSKARHFEPIEHIFFIKWFKKWVLSLVALSFKISRFWNWKFSFIWFFIKFIQWTCNFIEGGMFLLYKKIEINYMTLCIPFDSFFKNTLNIWLL